MKGLESGSVDAVITDPPYEMTELEFDQHPVDWPAWWAQARRVLKPNGVIVAFAAGLFTVDLIQSARDIYRYRLVWEKTRSTGFLDANIRPLRTHEDVLIFAPKLKSSTYNPQKTPSTRHTSPTSRKSPKGETHWGPDKQNGTWTDDGTRHPTSVLRVPSIRSQDTVHPTQKPVDLMAWLVRSYSQPGDLILDPFAGSGSTGVAAIQEGRRFLGCERDASFCELAQRRLAHAQPALIGQTA
ncbi:site-specific DNA-methyltransferase (plasmid) [Deinococcus radiomollis]|uniref:DNA-methyltransferase n=1 Tax=Deinococcus radiomollis TaxID=468916 RepID=UPI003892BDFD